MKNIFNNIHENMYSVGSVFLSCVTEALTFCLFSIGMTNHAVPKLCGESRDKAELFRERYTILQQARLQIRSWMISTDIMFVLNHSV